MAKIKRRRLRWNPSPSPQVVGYKLYWSADGGVDYDSNSIKLGNVTEIVLPDDVKEFAAISGPVELGIAAVDEIGNESDLVTLKTPFQFAVPQAPADLRLEAQPRPVGDAAKPLPGDAPEFFENPPEHRDDAAKCCQDRSVRPSLDNLRRHAGAERPEDFRSDTMPRNAAPFSFRER